MDCDIRDIDFTDAAWESLYDAVDDERFRDKDAHLIYDALNRRLKMRSFGDYLKRYIFIKAGLQGSFRDISIKEYQLIIREAFLDNHTPTSFGETTAKLSALSKNWLTQQTVGRKVVFLLGFGLNMGVEDVNMFLAKALRESEINPKDPFEVLCWYCYQNRYNYLKFEQLRRLYMNMAPAPIRFRYEGDRTICMRSAMQQIHDDKGLLLYLAKLKANGTMSIASQMAKRCFDALYDEARDLVAAAYNAYEREDREAAAERYTQELLNNDRLCDAEIQRRLREFRTTKKEFCREDITARDIERVVYAAIPMDRNGNLTPGKASKLNGQFEGKRLSRQRMGDLLTGKSEVTRFDLITLNFFVFSQRLGEYPDPKVRFMEFYKSMNTILKKCDLGEVYIQNPYECFVLMCILSDEPLSTYADVWELSYLP